MPTREEVASEISRADDDDAELLRIDEVAQRLRCSPGHVSKLINGKVRGVTALRTVGFGRLKRIRSVTLKKWIIENEAARSR
jgi:AraC-like DNA-binding protein